MKHLGDIQKINGEEITPVDVITIEEFPIAVAKAHFPDEVKE